MKIGEKNLPLAHQFVLRWKRFLHFHDHFRATEEIGRVVNNLGAGCSVIAVGITRAHAGVFLDKNGVATFGQLIRCGRQKTDAVLLLFYLFRYADDHLEEEISDA